MNKIFVTTERYGDLCYDEIFLYYDGPCIFSLKNKLGYHFISLLESESNKFDRYIIVPVSIERYNAFVKNDWSIRHMFTLPEQGGVFTVVFKQEETYIEYPSLFEIENMNLPDADEMLEYNSGYTSIEIVQNAQEKNIPILQKSLEKRGEHRQYIYANELAKESTQFQKVFDGIASDEIRMLPPDHRDQLAPIIKRACKVPIYGTYAASFGIRIEGTSYAKLGDAESDFTKYLKIYFELLNMGSETNSDFLKKHADALVALKGYYKTLLGLDFAVKMTAATPQRDYYKVNMSKDDIARRYEYLNYISTNGMEQLEVVGTWVQIDIMNRGFKFRTDSGTIIKGKIDDDFDESVFNFGKKTRILVERFTEIGRVGDESEKFTVLAVLSDNE